MTQHGAGRGPHPIVTVAPAGAGGRSAGRAGPVLAVVAGLLAAVGSLLAWIEARAGPFGVSARGIDGWEGKVTLIAGAGLLVGGITALMGARARVRPSALVSGLAAAGVGIYTALTARDQVVEGVVSISLEPGLYLVIAGGLIGIVAGVLGRTSDGVPAAAGEGSGLTGWAAPEPREPVAEGEDRPS